MTKKIIKEKTLKGFELLPAKASSNSIEIYHPFASLAKKHFSKKGFEIEALETGSIKISFEKLNQKEKKELSNEIKKFLKESRQEIIKDFLIYKKGTNYL